MWVFSARLSVENSFFFRPEAEEEEKRKKQEHAKKLQQMERKAAKREKKQVKVLYSQALLLPLFDNSLPFPFSRSKK